MVKVIIMQSAWIAAQFVDFQNTVLNWLLRIPVQTMHTVATKLRATAMISHA